MVTVDLGNKKRKFRSIKAAADAMGVPYMTLYMRLRFGVKPATAVKRPVRKYTHKAASDLAQLYKNSFEFVKNG